MAEERITVVRAAERRQPAQQTPGMVREEAYANATGWAGYVRTEPQRPSGWHHHGGYDSYIYVLEGRLRMHFGPEGRESIDAGPGDFVRVPPGTIHREENPSPVEGRLVVVRFGSGPPTINVEAPAPIRPPEHMGHE